MAVVGVRGLAACDDAGADLGERDGGIRWLRCAVHDGDDAVIGNAGSVLSAVVYESRGLAGVADFRTGMGASLMGGIPGEEAFSEFGDSVRAVWRSRSATAALI